MGTWAESALFNLTRIYQCVSSNLKLTVMLGYTSIGDILNNLREDNFCWKALPTASKIAPFNCEALLDGKPVVASLHPFSFKFILTNIHMALTMCAKHCPAHFGTLQTLPYLIPTTTLLSSPFYGWGMKRNSVTGPVSGRLRFEPTLCSWQTAIPPLGKS